MEKLQAILEELLILMGEIRQPANTSAFTGSTVYPSDEEYAEHVQKVREAIAELRDT